jgi:hypothetical protein
LLVALLARDWVERRFRLATADLSTALIYLEHRGIDRATAQGNRIGYAAGEEIVGALRWQRLLDSD